MKVFLVFLFLTEITVIGKFELMCSLIIEDLLLYNVWTFFIFCLILCFSVLIFKLSLLRARNVIITSSRIRKNVRTSPATPLLAIRLSFDIRVSTLTRVTINSLCYAIRNISRLLNRYTTRRTGL